MNVSDICANLATGDLDSRVAAADALAAASQQGTDISAAVPALATAALDDC